LAPKRTLRLNALQVRLIAAAHEREIETEFMQERRENGNSP